ncbi:TetR/AcrR family transcriptional regulator [Porticoccaceae bacterium LTM1]|nr:TetR/AcrR family transcriptional regulator [Porticoccaceae bacterium LTM1]
MLTANSTSTEKIREKKRRFLAREQRIVDAALELLLEQGIDRVTVSSIANRAGIGKGTIYKHFLTKNEIFMRIVLDYERTLAENLAKGIKEASRSNPGAAAKAYFQSRLNNPALDRLVQHLEARLEAEQEVEVQLKELHEIRRSNVNSLNAMVAELMKDGILEDVPPHYHYLSCWALAQGAVDLYFNKTLDGLGADDKASLLEYIAGIGVTMGNRGQLGN